MVCNTLDSCIMVLTAYADSMYTPYYTYARINLVKIDLEGNIIWNKKYGASKPVNLISNIIPLDNGDFMACGTIRDIDDSDMLGWLFRFDENGDSIWYKEYYHYLTSNGEAENYLYDVSFTADDGFISTGEAYTLFGPNHINKMWVVKVDSVGCEIPNCWVGIEENDGMEAWGQGGVEAGKQGSLEVWPNPCREMLNVKCLMLNAGESCSLSVYDIFGRPAISSPELTPLPASPTSWRGGEEIGWTIDVSSLPPGVYFISVLENGKRIAGGKFVVARH